MSKSRHFASKQKIIATRKAGVVEETRPVYVAGRDSSEGHHEEMPRNIRIDGNASTRQLGAGGRPHHAHRPHKDRPSRHHDKLIIWYGAITPSVSTCLLGRRIMCWGINTPRNYRSAGDAKQSTRIASERAMRNAHRVRGERRWREWLQTTPRGGRKLADALRAARAKARRAWAPAPAGFSPARMREKAIKCCLSDHEHLRRDGVGTALIGVKHRHRRPCGGDIFILRCWSAIAAQQPAARELRKALGPC